MSNLIGNIPVDPKDPWALAQTGYSPDKIYTRSTNGHDHSETLWVKVSPALMACIGEAIEKVAGYRSKADVVRDALIHRMHQANDWMNTGINMGPVDVEVRMAELEQMRANRAYWTSLIETLEQTLHELCNEGDFETAAYLIEENSAVDTMSPPYLLKLGAVIDRYRDKVCGGLPVDTKND